MELVGEVLDTISANADPSEQPSDAAVKRPKGALIWYRIARDGNLGLRCRKPRYRPSMRGLMGRRRCFRADLHQPIRVYDRCLSDSVPTLSHSDLPLRGWRPDSQGPVDRSGHWRLEQGRSLRGQMAVPQQLEHHPAFVLPTAPVQLSGLFSCQLFTAVYRLANQQLLLLQAFHDRWSAPQLTDQCHVAFHSHSTLVLALSVRAIRSRSSLQQSPPHQPWVSTLHLAYLSPGTIPLHSLYPPGQNIAHRHRLCTKHRAQLFA